MEVIQQSQQQDNNNIPCVVELTKKQKRMAKQQTIVSLSQFEFINVIGEGRYGTVLLAKKNDSGNYFALKVIKKSLIRKRQLFQRITDERNILSKCQSKFITKLHYSFANEGNYFYVLDYCPGGDLAFFLQRRGTINEKDAKFFAAQIVLMLEYLHSNNIVYRDLKPENILIEKNGYLKLGDFGSAIQNITEEDSHLMCGTPHYFAPEMINREGHGKPIDMWALGCIVFELVFGVTPFNESNQKALYERIRNGQVFFDVKDGVKVTNTFKDFINQLLIKDQSKRLGTKQFAEIKNHPWFNKLDWEGIANQTIPSPINIGIKKLSDVSNFNCTFTYQDASNLNYDLVDTDCSSDEEEHEVNEHFYYDGQKKL